jgi:hypothetical protein
VPLLFTKLIIIKIGNLFKLKHPSYIAIYNIKMDVSIRAFIYSLCSFVFSDDICSLNFMPNKAKLLSAIVVILLILVILYKKIIKTHNNFEHFDNNKYKCCRKIPKITDNRIVNSTQLSNIKYLPNSKLAELQTINTPCSNYKIKKSNIDYLYRKKDKSHAYLGNRCLNTYAISKKLMKRYKNVKNMFHADFPLFDKV